MFKMAQDTDWQSSADQQAWFEKFSSTHQQQGGGLVFSQFQSFLSETLYTYFKRFPSQEPDSPAKFSYQQEIQLFKKFDTKNDHVIDRDEFANLCQNWLDKTYKPSCALVVVDVQNDFIDGSLALINGPAGEDGAEVVPVINEMLSVSKFDLVAYTLDWHPPDHIGFHSNLHLRKYRKKQAAWSTSPVADKPANSGDDSNHDSDKDAPNGEKRPNIDVEKANDIEDDETRFKLKRLATKVNIFDTVLFDDGRVEQIMWPAHCVQNSWGAQLHPKLNRAPGAIYVEKGVLPDLDAYSAFWDNMHLNETGLKQELTSRRISDVIVCGLALDFCVAATALDSVKSGFVTFVVEDACRGVIREEIARRKEEMIAEGVLIVNSHTIERYLRIRPDGDNVLKSGNSIFVGDCQHRNGDHNSGNNTPTVAKKLVDPGNSQTCTEAFKEVDRSLIMSICYKRAISVSSGLGL